MRQEYNKGITPEQNEGKEISHPRGVRLDAILLEKSRIQEEIRRLRSRIEQMTALLEASRDEYRQESAIRNPPNKKEEERSGYASDYKETIRRNIGYLRARAERLEVRAKKKQEELAMLETEHRGIEEELAGRH